MIHGQWNPSNRVCRTCMTLCESDDLWSNFRCQTCKAILSEVQTIACCELQSVEVEDLFGFGKADKP